MGIASVHPGGFGGGMSGQSACAEDTAPTRHGDFIDVGGTPRTTLRAWAPPVSSRYEALLSASQAIFAAREASRLPEVIAAQAMRVMGADGATLLVPGVDQKLYIAYACGIPQNIQQATRIALGEGIAGRVAQSGVRELIVNAHEAGRSHPAGGHGRVNSSIVFPLGSSACLLGVLTFNRVVDTCPFDRKDLGLASAFAAQVYLALENARYVRHLLSCEKLAAMGELASGIAHELNTPMQYMGDNVGFLLETMGDLIAFFHAYQKLAKKGSSPAGCEALDALEARHDIEFLLSRAPTALEHVRQGVVRVTEIVRAVRSLAHSGGPTKVACDINRCLRDTVAVGRSEYKGVADVHTDLGDIPEIMAHPGELGQVFLNLLVNAAHAVADRIGDSGRRGTITLRSLHAEHSVIVEVRDDGCGISADHIGRIFEPFFTTKGVAKGTGLGLSIARTIIVEHHGGSIECESELGLGSVFRVTLPIGGPDHGHAKSVPAATEATEARPG